MRFGAFNESAATDHENLAEVVLTDKLTPLVGDGSPDGSRANRLYVCLFNDDGIIGQCLQKAAEGGIALAFGLNDEKHPRDAEFLEVLAKMLGVLAFAEPLGCISARTASNVFLSCNMSRSIVRELAT